MISSSLEAYPGASLEQSIDAAALWLATAPTVEQRRGAWSVLQELVKLRSQDKEKVRQMEIARGIHR